MGDDEEIARKVAKVIARLCIGDVPKEVKTALHSARLNGLEKAAGGIRVLGCGGVIRRMVYKQTAKELHKTVSEACGTRQFGLQRDGTGRLYRHIQAYLNKRPEAACASVDQRDAYSNVKRKGAVHASDKVGVVVGAVARSLLGDPGHHILQDHNGTKFLQQGCNMSTSLYCLSADDPLDKGLAAARAIDPKAELVAFIDDTYILGLSLAAEAGRAAYQEALKEQLGVEENVAKRKCMLGSKVDPRELPQNLLPYACAKLVVVGSHMEFARADRMPAAIANAIHEDGRPQAEGLILGDESRDVEVEEIEKEVSPEKFLLQQRAYFDRLVLLSQHGLPLGDVITLLQTWTQGACVHILRHSSVTDEWVSNVDRQITDVIGRFLYTTLDESQRMQVFLRVKDGGLGMGSAEIRKEAAWIGAWEGGLNPLLKQLREILPDLGEGPSGVQAMRELWPQWRERVDKMERVLRKKKGVSARPSAWDILASTGAQKTQKGHAGQVYENFQKKFHARLEDSMEIRLSAGPEAGAFLTQEEGPAQMSNENMRNALRRRLRVAQVEGSRGVCHHARTDKSICGKVFGHDGGRHIMNCKVGGGVDIRHNGVRDALGRWLEEIGKQPKLEQLVPK